MPDTRHTPSGYRAMWLFAMFDLPIKEKCDRKEYTTFRNNLIKEGFTMMQYSVYARYCTSEDAGKVFKKRVKKSLPPSGQVRVLSITDKQFGKMDVFDGIRAIDTETPPDQMILF